MWLFLSGFESNIALRASVDTEEVKEKGKAEMLRTIKPLYVVWESTMLCNLRCRHCYSNAASRHPGELTTEEAKNVIDQLSDMGTLILALSGGEPLFRRDWEEIAKYASSQDILVGIGTSGWTVDGDMARRIRDAGISRCTVSIDGASGIVHERMRPKSGSFERAVAAVRFLKDAGVRTIVGYTPTVLNIEDAYSMIEFAQGLGADAANLSEFVPTGRGSQKLAPNRQQLKNVIEFWSKEKEAKKGKIDVFWHDCRVGEFLAPEEKVKYVGCGAGTVLCRITVDGKVAPCVTLPIVVGDLRKQSLREIWDTSDILTRIRDRANIHGNCSKCELLSSCGGCRAMAYAWTGDLFYGDPMCWICPPAEKELLPVIS